jgi:hypothetical protein
LKTERGPGSDSPYEDDPQFGGTLQPGEGVAFEGVVDTPLEEWQDDGVEPVSQADLIGERSPFKLNYPHPQGAEKIGSMAGPDTGGAWYSVCGVEDKTLYFKPLMFQTSSGPVAPEPGMVEAVLRSTSSGASLLLGGTL